MILLPSCSHEIVVSSPDFIADSLPIIRLMEESINYYLLLRAHRIQYTFLRQTTTVYHMSNSLSESITLPQRKLVVSLQEIDLTKNKDDTFENFVFILF